MDLITWNPNDIRDAVLSEDKLSIKSTLNWGGVRATVGRDSGKWYWEAITIGSYNNNWRQVGIETSDITLNVVTGSSNTKLRTNGKIYAGEVSVADVHADDGNVVGIAMDLDNKELSFFLNGNMVNNGQPVNTLLTDNTTYYPVVQVWITPDFSYCANFGASKFDIVASNPVAWGSLVNEGYLPYDIENAFWFFDPLSFIIDNSILKTWNPDLSSWQEPDISEPLSVQDFLDHGMDREALNDTCSLKVIKGEQMEYTRDLGDGREFKTVIDLSKWPTFNSLGVS